MMIRICKTALFIFAFFMHGQAFAVNTVLSGIFDGSEPSAANLPGDKCDEISEFAYQEITGVTVSTSGTYTMTDVYNSRGVDLIILVYRGSFNPNSPQSNLISPDGFDVSSEGTLNAGQNHTLVLQHWCRPREGAWAIAISGPGSASSTNAVSVPGVTMGNITNADPSVNSSWCGDRYEESEAVRVSRTGTYYYSDVSINFDLDMCLSIYSAPFNPSNPNANLVGRWDENGTFELRSGRDYYFVVQPWDDGDTGEFFYTLVLEGPFRISSAMSGSWFDPLTAGQGFFMDVLDSSNQLFLAWFTYDLERPDADVMAMIGEPGHRWMTALGPFEGTSADLKIFWNSGMIFDSATPSTEQTQDGDMTVSFSSCTRGNIAYDLGTANVTGNVPVQRLANDIVSLCEAMYQQPGVPGPF
jgi:hypothetical protein